MVFSTDAKTKELNNNIGVLSGNADIDISVAVYTSFVEVLNIVADDALEDLVVDLDWVKAVTGVDVVATAADTLDAAVYSDPDGTNYRFLEKMTQKTLAGDGSLEESGHRFKIGAVPKDGKVSIRVKLSAERADAEIPYRVAYKGNAPTVTAVAAA